MVQKASFRLLNHKMWVLKKYVFEEICVCGNIRFMLSLLQTPSNRDIITVSRTFLISLFLGDSVLSGKFLLKSHSIKQAAFN